MTIERFYQGALGLAALLTVSITGCTDNPLDKIDTTPVTGIFDLECPGRTAHFDQVDTFLVIGHRGAGALEVENTIPSFQRAMDEGANSIELDFVMTKDGQIIVWHDWDPNNGIALIRESGAEFGAKYRPRFPPISSDMRRPADELTLEEFRANYWYATKNVIDKDRVEAEIPTFVQFMEWARNQPKLYYVFFDIKLPENRAHLAHEMIGRMDSIYNAFKPSWQGVYMSPNPTVWQKIGELLRNAPLSFDVDLGGGMVNSNYCEISSSTHATTRGGSGFATTMHPFAWTEAPWTTLKNLLTCDLERRDQPRVEGEPAIVQKVIAATINDEEKMRCLVELGIDGLMTDNPAMLVGIAKGMGKQVQ